MDKNYKWKIIIATKYEQGKYKKGVLYFTRSITMLLLMMTMLMWLSKHLNKLAYFVVFVCICK